MLRVNLSLPHCGHFQPSWTSAWRKGASRERTRKRARWLASRWAVLPRRGRRICAGRPDGTREIGWGSPWLDSRGQVKLMANRGVCLRDGCCCALLHSIYRPFCPVPSRLCLCSPHCDPANTLIFLEQWCQLLVPPLPSLCCFIYLCCFSFSLPPNSVCPFSLARCTADAPIFTPQEIPLSGSVCGSVCDGVCVCLRNICQSISLLCSDCQKLWVCE